MRSIYIIHIFLRKMIKKKLDDLANWFKDKYNNSSVTMKAFWHMMESSVEFLKNHLWIILATVMAIEAYEMNLNSRSHCPSSP